MRNNYPFQDFDREFKESQKKFNAAWRFFTIVIPIVFVVAIGIAVAEIGVIGHFLKKFW